MFRLLFPLVLLSTTPVTEGEGIPGDVKTLVDQRKAAIERIDRTFIDELEKLKKRYTKNGDLEAANQIVAMIREVESENTKRQLLAPSILGKWDVVYSNGVRRDYEFNATAVTMQSHSPRERLRGTYKSVSSGFLVDLGDQKLEIWSHDGEKWRIQHFNPAARYHSGQLPTQTAVATRRD